jgi:Protein of unknown function (DUF3147)
VTTAPEEATIGERVAERPSVHVEKLRELQPRELAWRFAAGAVTSIVSGAVTLAFGPRAGGILLAFPAILAASLTLIAEEEDRSEAREGARGAVIGGCALTLFAAVAALTLGEISGVLALVIATAAWLGAALIGYVVAWFR